MKPIKNLLNIFIALFLALSFYSGSAFASGEVKFLAAKDNRYGGLRSHFLYLIRNEESLIDAFKNLNGGDEDQTVRLIKANKIDFTKQAIVLIVGKKSDSPYSIDLVKSSFSQGVLEITVKIDQTSKSGSMKNPFYILLTDPQKVPLDTIKSAELYKSVNQGVTLLLGKWDPTYN